MQNNSRYSTAHYNVQMLDPETMKVNTFRTLIKEYINFRKTVPLGCITDLCSDPRKTQNDIAVFSGAGGYLYLYIRLYQFFQSVENHQIMQESIQNTIPDEQIYEIFNPDTHLQHAFKQFIEIEKVINKVKDQSASFLMSNSAIYYMGALLCYYKQDPDRFQVYITRIQDYYNDFLKKTKDVQFELLYGVPGYLFIILQIQKTFNDDQIDPKFKVNLTDLIYKLCYWIVQVGLQKEGEDVLKSLMNQQLVQADYIMKFPFYKSTYLGGAHGISGVVHILLQADEIVGPFLSQKDPLFHAILRKACIDSLNFVGSFLDKGENIPSSINNVNNNSLYQFCHGVPGLVSPLMKCFQLYKDNKQLERSKKSCESIWKYGMLKKGPGLCHGIPGNSYSFMYLYNVTKEIQYQQKAYVFLNYKDIPQLVEEIANFPFKDRFLVGQSDNPFSLYLGIAGNMCAQMDFLQFKGFPGYDI